MKVVGFNYTKVSAERVINWEPLKKINTDIQFTEVSNEKIEVMKEGDIVRIGFKFGVEYEPKNATIILEGFVTLAMNSDESNELIKSWTKKKELNKDLVNTLVKLLWKKCNLKAFQLEEELNIPTHLQLPQISIRPQKSA